MDGAGKVPIVPGEAPLVLSFVELQSSRLEKATWKCKHQWRNTALATQVPNFGESDKLHRVLQD